MGNFDKPPGDSQPDLNFFVPKNPMEESDRFTERKMIMDNEEKFIEQEKIGPKTDDVKK